MTTVRLGPENRLSANVRVPAISGAVPLLLAVGFELI
jgi:hypothetical protein